MVTDTDITVAAIHIAMIIAAGITATAAAAMADAITDMVTDATAATDMVTAIAANRSSRISKPKRNAQSRFAAGHFFFSNQR